MRALFPPDALEQVAGVIQARRRRPGVRGPPPEGSAPSLQRDFGGVGARLMTRRHKGRRRAAGPDYSGR